MYLHMHSTHTCISTCMHIHTCICTYRCHAADVHLVCVDDARSFNGDFCLSFASGSLSLFMFENASFSPVQYFCTTMHTRIHTYTHAYGQCRYTHTLHINIHDMHFKLLPHHQMPLHAKSIRTCSTCTHIRIPGAVGSQSVCMYVCMFVCMYVCVCLYVLLQGMVPWMSKKRYKHEGGAFTPELHRCCICTCIHLHMHTYFCTCMHRFAHAYHIFIFTCISYMYLHMHGTHTCICTCIAHTHVFAHACIHVHT